MLRVEPEIRQNYVRTGQVSLAFHPMLDHGDASRLAHRAAECAAEQDAAAFWPMHDLLFERQAQIWQGTPDLMAQWAIEIGLNGDALRVCLDGAAVAEKIERLDQARREQGIRLRPTFDVNGRLIQGGLPYAQFTDVFAELLNQ